MAKEFEYDFDVVGATSGEDRHELVRNDEPRDRVVYLHRRADDLQPFYIGIGSLNRAHSIRGRNIYWRRVYEKHDRVVEILHENLSFDEACEIEIRLIKEYREKYPNTMTNLTDGGEGSLGLKGEDACNFKGHVLFLSACGGYFFVCSGEKELEDSGFDHGNVCATILGSKNCEYVSSKKIHINGVKVRFKPIRFNDVSEIDDSLIANRVEAKVCEDEICGQAGKNSHLFGRNGELHNNFKGYSLGVSQSHFVLLVGEKDMKSKFFNSGNISACILGKRSIHKGFIWSRIDENITQESLKTLRDLQPYDEDSKDRLEELLNE